MASCLWHETIKSWFVVSWRDSESSLELQRERVIAQQQEISVWLRLWELTPQLTHKEKQSSLCSTWWFLYQLCIMLLLLKKCRSCLSVAAAERITSKVHCFQIHDSCTATAVIISSWCLDLHLKSHDSEVIRILGEVEKMSTAKVL